MKRTAKKPVERDYPADAILTADLHLTESTPISRTDDYTQAQQRKLKFLRKLSRKNDKCPILCSGDVFDYWKASPWLSSWVYRHIPQPFIAVPGQHDLPGHSLQNYERSALSLLERVGRATVLKEDIYMDLPNLDVVGYAFGQEPIIPIDFRRNQPHTRRVLLLHELIWPGNKPTWAKHSYSAEEILERFEESFGLIVTGDNHQSFTVRRGDCLLVNPGSMMRINADQSDFKPKCYLYYAQDNEVVPVEFPIDEDVHDREHLDKKKERDERIMAYIERMSSNWEGGLSFRDNLQAFFEENDTPRKVREIIWQHLEKEVI